MAAPSFTQLFDDPTQDVDRSLGHPTSREGVPPLKIRFALNRLGFSRGRHPDDVRDAGLRRCQDAGGVLGGDVGWDHRVLDPRSVGVRSDAGRLAAMAVADYRPPTWPEPDVPKQIHLDLAVDDLEAAVAEAIRHGATPAAFQPAPEARRILLDPAGHPFCLTTMIPRESGADGD